ncbi:MAG: hypothetical protein V3V72_08880 [Ignavibacteriaceae bacterium]
MKTISIVLPDEIAKEFEKNRADYETAMKRFLINEMQKNSIEKRLELVKVITRIKSPVKNWPDLEKEIFHAAIR